MTKPKPEALRRALYRASQRGLLELDLILGGYVKERMGRMDAKEFGFLEEVLKEENPILLRAVMGQEPPPVGLRDNPVMQAILSRSLGKLRDKCVPETRAPAGKDWIQPWNDLQKKW